MKHIFEWPRVLFNDLPAEFLLEVIFRSAIMFIFLLIVIKLTGKRGVKQLSVFETVIIIALGSAAGDPMFYENVGILPALIVFLVVLLLYRLVTWLTGKSKRFEQLLEGKTECLIEDGKFSIQKFKKESLGQDEFFTELRMRSIEHLGQVKNAYIETTGDVSVYFYKDDEVKFGLPIIPQLFCEKSKIVTKNAVYACCNCGFVIEINSETFICPECNNSEWVKAINTKRVT